MKDKSVILVVDDEPQNIELLEAYLAPLGYEIVTAANGEEALGKLSGNKIDLILLDILMPGMDGFEVTRRVRQDNTHRLLPIILITVLWEKEDRVKGIEAGCDDFLSKPVDKMELLARVRSLLKVKAYNDLMSNYRKELESEVTRRTEELKHALENLQQDNIERKRAEEELLESEEKYRTILKDMEDVYFEVDIKGIVTFVNASSCKMSGYSEEELLGMPFKKISAPDDIEKVMQYFGEIFLTGKTGKPFLWNLVKKNREQGFFEIIVSLIRDKQGKPIGFRGIGRDVTERKRAEEVLKQSENKYRLLADNVHDVIFVLDMNLKYTYISPSVKILRGYEPEEVLKQQSIEQTLTPSSQDLAMRTFSEIMEQEKTGRREISMSRTLQLEMRRKDGTTVWTEVKFSFIRDEDQRPVGIMGLTRDITERKRIEEVLREGDERYRALFDRSLDLVYIVDFEGRFIDANVVALNRLGYTREEIRSLNFGSLLSEDQLPLAFKIMQEMRETGIQMGLLELRLWHKNGSDVYVETQGSTIMSNGIPVAIQAIARDITERKRAEEVLQQTLESLRKAFGATVQAMVSAVEVRDPYTAGHQIRTADLARAIATEMGLSQEKIDGIRMAGSIHDIGKLSIPAEILSKPTKLTNIEFSLIKEHSRSGYEMLKNVESPWPLAQIVYQHHERMNGSGYPRNLKGDEILIEARIMAVADVVEAMASHRPYRPALGLDAALEEIEKNKGIFYDDAVADACLKLFREKGYQLT